MKMANPIFNTLNAKSNTQNAKNQPDMVTQFRQFVQQMRGQNPDKIINDLVSGGKISQSQLNQVQNQAKQMENQFKSMFRF